MTKGKNLSELPKDIFAKQKPGKGKNEKTEKLKEIARMEAQIYRCDYFTYLISINWTSNFLNL